MAIHGAIDLTQLINTRPLGRYQVRIILLCTLSMILDGYDVQVMGYVAPALLAEWGLQKTALTPVFSAGVIGMLVGSLLSGLASDRYGRRSVLLASMLGVSVGMLATPYAASPAQLIIIRFLTGLAMGAIVPNAVSLGGEYSPARLRATLMMTITCGYLVGAMFCGLVAALILPGFGWRAVFVAGGLASLVLCVAMARWMPESLQFLALRPERRQETLHGVRQLYPDLSLQSDVELAGAAPQVHGGRLAELFHRKYRRSTLLLWAIYFLNLLAVFFLASWLPILLRDAGHSAPQAILAGAALWGGGIAGTLSLGWAIDRFGYGRVLSAVYLLATAGILATGVFLSHLPLAMMAIAISGFAVMGAQAALNALAATLYPTHIRATGVGWGLGIGRLGSVVGPIVGGELIGLGWDAATLLAAVAIPTGVAMLAALSFGGRHGAASGQATRSV